MKACKIVNFKPRLLKLWKRVFFKANFNTKEKKISCHGHFKKKSLFSNVFIFFPQILMSVSWQMVDVRRTVTIPMEAFIVHVQLVLSFTMNSGVEVKRRVRQESKRFKLVYTEKYLTFINLLLITR